MKTANEIIYFVFPLLFAGLIHHLLIIRYNLFSFIAKPIDGSRLFQGRILLGKSKTWRGLIVVPVFSGLGSLIISQTVLVQTILEPFWTGLIIGLGYAIAELPNSFIKRRLNMPIGQRVQNKFSLIFLIFDQTDSVIGAILAMLIIYPASLRLCLYVLIIGSFLHLLVDLYLHNFGYKKLRN
jgi:hypothetical protein